MSVKNVGSGHQESGGSKPLLAYEIRSETTRAIISSMEALVLPAHLHRRGLFLSRVVQAELLLSENDGGSVRRR